MPHLRGITVHVTDSGGKCIPEFGTQYLRQQSKTMRVSTYIQSTTDVSFQVSLQPDIPFVGHFSQSAKSGGEKVLTGQKESRSMVDSEDLSADRDHQKPSNDTLSSPLRPSTVPQSHSAPDFTFLASLFLDGRKKPERKISKALSDFLSPRIDLLPRIALLRHRFSLKILPATTMLITTQSSTLIPKTRILILRAAGLRSNTGGYSQPMEE